jgi:ferritin-like metal-binding protein YciE
VDRLEEVFALLDKKPQGKNCLAILGMVEEATEVMSDYKDLLLSTPDCSQRPQSVEHYEILR